jgi:Inner membrane protein YgaP-like, transmembrane domain
MTTERLVRIFAGTVVLASLALGLWLSPNFFWLTAFAGANLLQSGFTRLCPPEWLLKKLGVRSSQERA